MKRFTTFLATLFSVIVLFAQKEYYTSVDGTKGGEPLKTALHNLIKNHKQISYGSGESNTWGAFYTTDAVVENGKRRVLDMYSSEKRYFSSKGSVIDGMNIEHSVAKSWWGGAKNNAYCDIHHLNPSDQSANSRKSNYPLGELTSVSWDNGVTFVGSAMIDGTLQNAYEPCDEYKGDFARVFMYMFTCYQNLTWEKTWMNYEKSTYPTLKPWAVELLLKWHKQDPVSEKEVNRNNAVYAVQGNRNPYVDYPQLADYVWGDSVNYVFHLTGEVEEGTGDNTGGGDDGGDYGGDNGDDNGDDNEEGNGGNDNEGNGGIFTDGEFVLVTDATQLTVGDSIVIVYENYVMGKQTDKYRAKTDVVTSNGKVTYLADDAQIVVLKEGAVAGTYALYVGNGYLAATSSSSNHVITTTTLNADASWKITIDGNALATIKAQGSYTRNTLQYNTSAPRFSCYKSGQKSVNIYAKSPATTDIVAIEDGGMVDVYTITGVVVRKGVAPSDALQDLPRGVYIVGGKKCLIK